MYEILYQTPSINETVMKILYNNTDYDWRFLFEYEAPVRRRWYYKILISMRESL